MENNSEHYHCLHECEHPQPFEYFGVMWCGRCFFVYKALCPMILCIPGLNCA